MDNSSKHNKRPIKGFERYSVDTQGNVFGVNGEILKKRKTTNGYLRVNLRRKGQVKPTSKTVHRIVAETFIPNPNGEDTINHIDGNKTNNNVNNLEWCSFSDNVKHAWATGLMDGVDGGWGKTEEGGLTQRGRERLSYQERVEIIKKSHSTERYKTKAQKRNKEVGNTRTVVQIDKHTGEHLMTFDNSHEAGRSLFGSEFAKQDRLISRVCREGKGTAYGYAWEYKQEGGE